MFKKKLYLICLAVLPLIICSGMIYSILSLYIQDLGASKTTIGLVFMTGATAGALISPLLGRISDKFGRKKILLVAMICFSIVFLMYSLMKNYWLVFPIQLLEGATWAAFSTTVPALLADNSPANERGWTMGIYNRTWSIGWILGPAIGGFMADRAGFQATFFLGFLLVSFGFLLTAWLVTEE